MPEGLGAGFEIGVTPIGTPVFDITPTRLAQYASSPTITALLQDISAWLDASADLDNFYDYVWNIESAQGFGLDIWGRIVDVQRVLPITDVAYFGFEEATTAAGFGQGVFWSGAGGTTNFSLGDDAYRRLILAKAMANVLDGSIPAINLLLRNMFPGRGNAFVADNQDMTLTYTFQFALTPVDVTLVVNSGVLPQPAGIQVKVEHQ